MNCKSVFFARSLSVALSLMGTVAIANAACVSPAPANAAAIQAFTNAPTSLLSTNPNGGAALISAIRNLVVSDRAAVSGISALIASANPDQIAAIGTAMGQATNLCLRTELETAVALQTLVATADKPALTAAFRAVAGDPRTAATGGNTGGAQGGAAGGGQGAAGGGGLGGSGVTGSGTTSASGGGRNDSRPVTLTNSNSSNGINAGSGSSVSPLSRRSASASVSPSR